MIHLLKNFRFRIKILKTVIFEGLEEIFYNRNGYGLISNEYDKILNLENLAIKMMEIFDKPIFKDKLKPSVIIELQKMLDESTTPNIKNKLVLPFANK